MICTRRAVLITNCGSGQIVERRRQAEADEMMERVDSLEEKEETIDLVAGPLLVLAEAVVIGSPVENDV